ncbi:MAG: hypothetical protein HY671_12050 [Chloroflexi bacterium]|nr:hypothetical protein [Chloroflexota bacterium]
MALPKDAVEMLLDPKAFKVLATTDDQGNVHVVAKDSLTLLDDGSLAYGEVLESSVSNANMVRGIWFDRRVAVLVCRHGRSFQIKGKPHRYVTTGPLFQQFYLAFRQRFGPDSDLAGVWIIAVDEVREQTLSVRKEEEERKHPNMRHFDRECFKVEQAM